MKKYYALALLPLLVVDCYCSEPSAINEAGFFDARSSRVAMLGSRMVIRGCGALSIEEGIKIRGEVELVDEFTVNMRNNDGTLTTFRGPLTLVPGPDDRPMIKEGCENEESGSEENDYMLNDIIDTVIDGAVNVGSISG